MDMKHVESEQRSESNSGLSPRQRTYGRHREKVIAKARAYYLAHKEDYKRRAQIRYAKNRDAELARRKDEYAKRVEIGLCTRSGCINPPAPNCLQCRSCLDKHNARVRSCRDKIREAIVQRRKDWGTNNE